ncbi:DUF4352 domain-containing protein [Symbiobacterium terraclitae]|uniref:DUF4352 domain-containing protein n=1 Tax=Symbiobacterium terraclitae TaxID=557451 RepID=UPI0035B566E2
MNEQSSVHLQAPGSVPPTHGQPAEPQQPVVRWYHRKWIVVLMLLFCFPVGLVLLWTSPVTRLSGRIVWTTVIALVLLMQLGGGRDEQQGSTTETQPTSAAVAPASDARQTAGQQPVTATEPAAPPASTEPAAPPASPAPGAADEFNLTVTDQSTGTVYKGKVVSNVGFAVLDVDTVKSVGSDFFVEEAAGGAKFVMVTVYVTNEQKEAFTLDTSLFTLVADGKEYEYSIEAANAMEFSDQTESLFLKQLNPGLSVVATIPFEVPESLSLDRAELQFRAGLFGRAERVPLSPVTE